MALSRAALAATVLSFVTGCDASSFARIECAEYGVDYTGYDVLVLSGVGSSNQCMDSCAQDEACQYWSWDSETSSCFLKSAAAILGRTPKASIVSGPKTCNVDYSCFEEGVDYVGFDLLRIEGQGIPSAFACQNICRLEPQCAFFSYKASSRGCYLKSSGALVGSIRDDDVISGPRICQADDPEEVPDIPAQSCAEGSSEYRGHDTNITQNVRSAAHCQELCVANSMCYYWTWDKNKSTCYEKDSTANEAIQSGAHTLGKVSGAKYCVPLNPGCQLMDMAFQGKVIRELRNSTFEACQANCQSDASCKYWTYTPRKLCQLKEATPFGYIAALGSISGPKYCPNNDLCMEQADYVGHDIESIQDGSVSSANSCRALCRKTEGCELWTWVASTKNCYMKSAEALLGKTNGLSSIGRYSGPRECFMHYGSSSAQQKFCIDINAAYLDANATRVKNVNSYKECEEHCLAKSSCLLWTYLSSSRSCLLNEAESDKIAVDGAMSGRRDCTTAGIESCLFPGVKYEEAEISFNEAVTSATDCQLECVRAPSCNTFTFEESVGCYMYSKNHNEMAQYPTKFPTVVSGPRSCGSTAVSQRNRSIPMEIFTASTKNECATLCAANSCISWSFNTKLRSANCTIRSASTTARSVVITPGLFDGYKYEGTPVNSTTTETAEECRKACETEGHTVWNFYSDVNQCEMYGREAALLRVPDLRATCGTAEDPRFYNGLEFAEPAGQDFTEECETTCKADCRAYSHSQTKCMLISGKMPELEIRGGFIKFMFR